MKPAQVFTAALVALCVAGCDAPKPPSPPAGAVDTASPLEPAQPLDAGALCDQISPGAQDNAACRLALTRIQAQAPEALWREFSGCVGAHEPDPGGPHIADVCLTEDIKRFLLEDMKHGGHDHGSEEGASSPR